MTKMIKLSLAAAVAVSALSTTATAGSLENAIKDTTISGKALVGYNYADNKLTEDTTNSVEYDLDLTLTTKVNDMVTATVGFQADHDVDVSDETTDASKSNDETLSASDNITLTKLYFTAKTDVATVIVGKQGQPTPFLDDERGDGVVALIPAGPVTIAAGSFTGMTGPVASDINALAAIGSFGPVNASLWFLDVPNVADGFSLNLSAKVGPVNLDFTHSDVSYEDYAGILTSDESATLTKLVASATVADVNLVAAYAMTNDDDDGRGLGVALDGDDDAKTNFRMDQISLDVYNDADAILLGASMTFGQTTVGANYLMATANDFTSGLVTDKLKATELDLTVKYAMSKNFSITGLYADTDAKLDGDKIIDTKHMELSLNYKF